MKRATLLETMAALILVAGAILAAGVWAGIAIGKTAERTPTAFSCDCGGAK